MEREDINKDNFEERLWRNRKCGFKDINLTIDIDSFIEIVSKNDGNNSITLNKITFNNCNICITGILKVSQKSVDVQLSFYDCRFSADFNVSKLGIKRDIIFSKCNFKRHNLEITDLFSRCDANIGFKILVERCENINLLKIANVKYNESFLIEVVDSQYSKIECRDGGADAAMLLSRNNNDCTHYFINKFNKESFDKLDIGDSGLLSFVFEYCEFDIGFLLKDKTYKLLRFVECIFANKLHIEETELDEIIFEGCKFQESAKIFNLSKPLSRAVFTYCTIEGLFIFNGWYGGVLRFKEKNTEIDFSNVFVKRDAYIIIRNVNVYVDKAEGQYRVNGEHHGIFNFSNSNILGGVVFNNVCAQGLNLQGAAIVGDFIVENIDIEDYSNRVTCVKLKNEFIKQNDYISAIAYRAKEMGKYWKEVNKRKQCLILKIPEYFLLFLNLFSNRYGRWWFLGVLYTFFVAFLFYTLYYFSLSGNDVVWFPAIGDWLIADGDYMKNVLSYLWVLDTSGLKELNSVENISICSYIWYILGKIFVGYGIYQTISAFRKYGK